MVNAFGRLWEVVADVRLSECWLVFAGFDGELYMDSLRGYLYLVRRDGDAVEVWKSEI